MLEQRCCLGSDAILPHLDEIRDRFRNKRTRAFLRYKVQERADRGNVVGASLFVMEPNLKTNPRLFARCPIVAKHWLHALRQSQPAQPPPYDQYCVG